MHKAPKKLLILKQQLQIYPGPQSNLDGGIILPGGSNHDENVVGI